ncbi:MAG: PIN domain-containing protein [Bacteroidetes bacterium]|nr:PIN domain-containing protein [Bacteroidota bacterium]
MTNIALDTNIWIYLTKDSFYRLFCQLKKMKSESQIKIIVNDVLIQEWNRNKPQTIKTLSNNIKQEYKAAINLANYFKEPHKSSYLQTISEYKEENYRIERATKRVGEVEDFMKSCAASAVTETQKLFIANLAISKKPPFQNNKNNFNDALILRNIYEFAENMVPQLYDLIYVSNNPDDFTDNQTKEIYPDILEGLSPKRLKNVRELGEALKLAPELIPDFDDWLEYQLDMHFDYDRMMNK